MKNIHVLPTDKPSRLFYNVGGALLFTKWDNYNGVNIYITSDEEIKIGDWILKCKNINDCNFKSGELEEKDYSYFAVKCVSLALLNPEDKKIILTTDQDLIKDGVQAIDDEFLEWFVKNPSCESVEVERDSREVGSHNGGIVIEYGLYEIIIPKEEPKQETLEEVAENYMNEFYSSYAFKNLSKHIFIDGAKWQQERMYSEEEVINIFFLGRESLHKALVTKEEALDIIKTNKI